MGLDFGAFAAGAANAGSEDIEKRRDTALQIKLRSKMAEMSLNNALIENQQKADLASSAEKDKYLRESNLSPDFAAGLGTMSGLPAPTNVNEGNIAASLAKARASAAERHQAAMDRLAKPRLVTHDDGNTYVTQAFNPTTGEKLWESGSNSKLVVGKLKGATAAYEEGKVLIDQMRRGVEAMNLGADFPDNLGAAARLRLNDVTQSNPKAYAFKQAVFPYAQRLEKMITGGSRNALPLVQGMVSELPNAMDTVQSAKEKLDVLEGIFESAFTGQIKAWGTPVSSVSLKSDSGGFTADDFAKEDVRRMNLKKKAVEEKAKLKPQGQ